MAAMWTAMLAAFLVPAAAFAAPAAVSGSTESARPRGIEDIYSGASLRDPFREVAASSARSAATKTEFKIEDFNIHEVDLRGIMKDKEGAYAILVDIPSQVSLVLREGHVYTFKNKRIPGVSGRINMAQKSVVLQTVDNDVQALRLGEEEGEPEDKE